MYDTSSLITLKKKGESLEDGQDFTTIFSIIEYPKALEIKNLTIIYPQKSTFETAVHLSSQLLRHGTPIPAMDILIASIAIIKNLVLITKDKHFELIKSIQPDFKLNLITNS